MNQQEFNREYMCNFESELYSFDIYNSHKIFINYEICKYYGYIYFNGTCVYECSGYNPEKLIDKCKEWVDE